MTLRKLSQREVKKIKVMTAELVMVRQREINQGGIGKHEARWKYLLSY